MEWEKWMTVEQDHAYFGVNIMTDIGRDKSISHKGFDESARKKKNAELMKMCLKGWCTVCAGSQDFVLFFYVSPQK